MKKIGMFTGKFYDINIEDAEECLQIVNDDISKEDIEKIKAECKQCEFYHEHVK